MTYFKLRALAAAVALASMSAMPQLALAESPSDTQANWAGTVGAVADSVVAINLSRLRAYDDDAQTSTTATGFVVDAERGLLLTNRHVIGAGPVRATATFQNQERVDLIPVYRDPIHDFGIFRYDPSKLRFAKPRALELDPEGARRGLNIRVIGSDGGEQLSILAGTIARLDRAAPRYGRYGFSDFNTFYYQAASGTSGGSSGSPVVDINGKVVALNAGANSKTASSFFLPLWRIQHALSRLQSEEPVARGGLETVFSHKPYRTVARFGVPTDVIEASRKFDADNTGMLVVGQVFPGGVAEGGLQVGDVLTQIDGETVHEYVALDAVLDARVGEQVDVEVYRQGKPVQMQMQVADLHAGIPQRILEIGGGLVHDMTLHQSRTMNKPRRGVAVVDTGYVFRRGSIPDDAIITSINSKPVDNLDDFLAVLGESKHKDQWLVRYIAPGREHTTELSRVKVDHRWFEANLCERRDNALMWQCEIVEQNEEVKAEAGTMVPPPPATGDALLDRLSPLLVRVDFDLPHPVSNVYATNFRGTGLLIDPAAGLVVVDRNTVPATLGDVQVTLFGTEQVSGKVVYLHPQHNIAFIKIDPSRLPLDRLEAPQLRSDFDISEKVSTLVGFGMSGNIIKQPTGSSSSDTLIFGSSRWPRFVQSPMDAYSLLNPPRSLGGVLTDDSGLLYAFWTSFAFPDGNEVSEGEWGMPADILRQALEDYRSGDQHYALDAALSYVPLYEARMMGLTPERTAELAGLDVRQRRALYVREVQDESALQVGDVLVAVDGQVINSLRSLEIAVQKPQVMLTVLRDGTEQDVDYLTEALAATGAERVVSWNGVYVQEVTREVRHKMAAPVEGVYISSIEPGSPTLQEKLYPNRLITAVDGVSIASLDEFVAQLKDREAGGTVRLSTHLLSDYQQLVSVDVQPAFWPNFELQRDDEGNWTRSRW